MKINYIVATYFGPRRSYSDTENKFMFLEEQLKFLSAAPVDWQISRATISINYEGSVSKEDIESLVNSYSYPIEVVVRYRDNFGYSYSNWNEVMIECLEEDFDYFFLMEDDYIPTSHDFLRPFLEELTAGDYGFCCLLKSDHGFMGHQSHPTMSVGLVDAQVAKIVYDKHQNILWLHPTSANYTLAEESQIHMMDHFVASGYPFVGLPLNIRRPFWDNSLGLWERGGIDPPIIIPIGVEI